MGPDRTPYQFEREGAGRRDPQGTEARGLRDALLQHLGVKTDWNNLSAEVRGVVEDFVTHVLLNISWYQRKARDQYRMKLAADVAVVLIMIFAAILGVFVAMKAPARGVDNMGSLAAGMTAILAMLKFVSEAHDFQRYRSNFWEAAAALKTRLYALESECLKDKTFAVDEQGAPTAALVARLREEVFAAQKICFDQQGQYYQILAEPSALITAATTARPSLDAFAREPQRAAMRRRLRDLKEQRLAVSPRLAALRAMTTRSDAETAEMNTLAAREAELRAQESVLGEIASTDG